MTTETVAPESVNLHIIPINLDEWTHVTAFLSCAEEGALMRAVRVSWAAGHRGEAPGTLPDDDRVLTRMLGGEADQVALLRRFFAPDGEGRLRWEWLASLYEQQVGRYRARVSAAAASWASRPEGTSRRAAGRRNAKAGTDLRNGRCNAAALHVQPEPDSYKEHKNARDERARAPVTSLAAASRAAPAPRAGPNTEPTPVEVDAWAKAHPGDVAEIEHAVDTELDALNPRWRTSPLGGAVRTRYVRTRISARLIEARASPGESSPTLPHTPLPLEVVA